MPRWTEVASGLMLALWLPNSFSLGAWVTAGILTAFAFLLRRSHLIAESHERYVADATTSDGRKIDDRHSHDDDRSGQRSVQPGASYGLLVAYGIVVGAGVGVLLMAITGDAVWMGDPARRRTRRGIRHDDAARTGSMT